MASSTRRRAVQPAGLVKRPLVSSRGALARRLMPLDLRGQAIRSLRNIFSFLNSCTDLLVGRQRPMPADRLRTQQRLDVDHPSVDSATSTRRRAADAWRTAAAFSVNPTTAGAPAAAYQARAANW